MSSGRPLRLLRAAAVVIAAPIVFLGLLEGGLRLAGFGYPASFWTAIPSEPAVETNRYFGLRFFPAALARTPEPIRLDNPKPAGVYRIFVIGGSAAMGFPEPAFSFGRILEVLLEERYAGVNFEVVNAAMTAINSHVALPIVRDSARYEPDAFVVYLGNNEVVGPYGPGTVFGSGAPHPALLRWAIAAGGTRIGQAFRQALAGIASSGERPTAWRGMEMFIERQVAVDDPRLERVYSSLSDNLAAMASIAREAGAQIVLSTVAVNLRDCPPFAPGAGPPFEGASTRDQLEAARDHDQLRFRADSRINQTIRRTAADLAGDDLRLADAEDAFAADSPLGAPGDEWLLEHVHLRFEGAWLLARLMAESLAPGFPMEIQQAAGGSWLTANRAAEQLAYTPWDRSRIDRQIHELMLRPPFTLQAGHAERSRLRREKLDALDAELRPDQTLQQYERAIERRPQDPSLLRRHAELLAVAGQPDAAADVWTRLLARLPRRPDWLLARGAALRDAGRFEESASDYRAVLAQKPDDAPAHFGLATTLQQQGDATARSHYDRALEIDPGYAEAHNNIGLILLEQGDPAGALDRFDAAIAAQELFAPAIGNRGLALVQLGRGEEALAAFEAAIAVDRRSASAHFQLGSLLASMGRYDEAAPSLETALRLDPQHAEAAAGLGAVRAAQGNLEQAQTQLEQAVALQPSMAEAHFSLGKVLEMRGQPEAAIERYRAALEARADYPEAMNNLGITLARQGRLEESAAVLARAVELHPDFEPARINLEKVRSSLRR